MTEPSMDQKIEQLVRSVLEAVDSRLADMRQEVRSLAEDVNRRHHDVLQQINNITASGERNVHQVHSSATGGDDLTARMEQATQVLLERIEAMNQRATIATNDRFAHLTAAVEELRGDALSPATPGRSLLNGLDAMNAPLRAVAQPNLRAAAPAAPAAHSAPVVPMTNQGNDQIDMEKLADLLTERLGNLAVPPRSD